MGLQVWAGDIWGIFPDILINKHVAIGGSSPSIAAWDPNAAATLELANTALMAYTAASNSDILYSMGNLYYNGTNWVYRTSDFAAVSVLNSGSSAFILYGAPSGTAGANATLTELLHVNSVGGIQIDTPTTAVVTAAMGTGSLFYEFWGSASLIPASFSNGPAFVSGSGSPNRGSLIIGDGSGWTFFIGKRTGSVSTALATFGDGAVGNPVLSLAALSTGNALTVSTAGTAYGIINNSTTTAGSSFGMQLNAGTNSSDICFLAQNAAKNSAYFQIRGDGALAFHGATPQAVSSGWGTPTGNAVVANFPGATATLVQCSNVIAQLLTYFKALGLLAT